LDLWTILGSMAKEKYRRSPFSGGKKGGGRGREEEFYNDKP
jgi:hypothetical protein